NSEERKLHHFHFTCWPDRGVAEDVTSLIEFGQLVFNTSTKLNGPRVGQYQFLHRALVHSLTLDCNPVKGGRYQQFVDNLSDNDRENMFQGHWRKKRFLVAQTPLPETVDDFLTLIYQESCSCIVSFETDIGNNESVGLYFPADNQVLNKRAFCVESLRQDGKAYNTRRTLMLRHRGEHKETNEISIPQLEFTAWDSSRNTPRSASEFLDSIDDVEEASRESTSGGPILIHCIDGASKSGLFCVVSLLLQKMAIEHE
ncbi:PTPRR-like protein, partial [Mya arenaria]